MVEYVTLTSGSQVAAAVAYGPAIARCGVCDALRGYPTALDADRWTWSHWACTGHPTEWVGG